MDTELTITDWSGQTIGVGDTVIYAPGERYRSGMGYFKVLSIKIVSRTSWRSRYDTPDGRWQKGATYHRWEETAYVRQVRLKPLNFTGSDRTVTEGDNPFAFNSLTRFTVPVS